MKARTIDDLREMLCKELDEIAEKGELSAGTLETVHKLTDTYKNLGKIEMLEEYDGYSQDGGDWEARGSYEGGSSYARDGRRSGMHYVRGHYSRADGMDDEYSMARGRDSRGRYSRDGYSRAGGKQEMIEQLDDMIESAGSEREREALRKAKEKIQNA